jgi:transcriptional regulator with XRE-family HTH domain
MKAEQLGSRIQRFREMAELSRHQLAERTGLTEEFLQRLEEESVYPSLGPLLKVARALGVRLGTFLDDELGQDPLVVRLGERTEELRMHGTGCPGDLKFYALGKGKKDRHMEPFFIELLPATASCTDVPLSSHEGEEFLVVVNGCVEVIYGREFYELNQGDSIYLNSIVPHLVRCKGNSPASIYAVLYFPE